MKRKNNLLSTLAHNWYSIRRELHATLMQLFVLLWIVGMGGFAVFVLMLWLSV